MAVRCACKRTARLLLTRLTHLWCGCPTANRQPPTTRALVTSFPHRHREKKVDNECILSMQGNTTIMHANARGKEHKFTYDHSFWSYGLQDSHFVDQRHIFDRMGVPLLNKAFEGYNCCLFAYGQTGSGKSYSMMGLKDEAGRGIIPRFSQASPLAEAYFTILIPHAMFMAPNHHIPSESAHVCGRNKMWCSVAS